MRTLQTLILFLFLLGTVRTYAQECSVSLSGTFQLDSADGGLYDALVFDGAGKVTIHSIVPGTGDFLQVGDMVVVYPDKSMFKFIRKDDHTLVGVSTWVQDQVFRRMENDTVVTPRQPRDEKYAELFYEFYTLTGRDAPGLGTYFSITMDSDLRASMDMLCAEGFPKACLTVANALMLKSPELAAYMRGTADENQKGMPDKEIFDYFMKAIDLNEMDAIAQMGSYFLLLGHKTEAKKVFEKGCDLGHSGCCFALAGLEIGEEEDEEE